MNNISEIKRHDLIDIEACYNFILNNSWKFLLALAVAIAIAIAWVAKGIWKNRDQRN